jgi:hypothetical protein
MVSYKDLAILAATGVSAAAGEWTMNTNAYDTSTPVADMVDVTIHVHTHTPIQEFANPATANYNTYRETGCIALSNSYTTSSNMG